MSTLFKHTTHRSLSFFSSKKINYQLVICIIISYPYHPTPLSLSFHFEFATPPLFFFSLEMQCFFFFFLPVYLSPTYIQVHFFVFFLSTFAHDIRSGFFFLSVTFFFFKKKTSFQLFFGLDRILSLFSLS